MPASTLAARLVDVDGSPLCLPLFSPGTLGDRLPGANYAHYGFWLREENASARWMTCGSRSGGAAGMMRNSPASRGPVTIPKWVYLLRTG